MKRTYSMLLVLAVLGLSGTVTVAQQSSTDDKLTPEQFSEILKAEWTFLRTETEAYLAESGSRNEFETTPEYEQRSATVKANYLLKISKRMKDQKFDTRSFGVLLKAKLLSYDADKGQYAVACSVAVEAPYTIPSILTFVPTNKAIRVQDTIVGGYRTSRLMLKYTPHLTWKVDRPTAMQAKSEEGDLYFRVRSIVDITQPNIKDQALLRVIPKEIQLVNVQKNTIFWREEIQ